MHPTRRRHSVTTTARTELTIRAGGSAKTIPKIKIHETVFATVTDHGLKRIRVNQEGRPIMHFDPARSTNDFVL